MKKIFSIIFTLLCLVPAVDAQEKPAIPVRDINDLWSPSSGDNRHDSSLHIGSRPQRNIYFIDGQMILSPIYNPKTRLLPQYYDCWSQVYIDGIRPGDVSPVLYLLDGSLFLTWEAFTGEQPLQQRFPALYNIYHEADFKYIALGTFLERLPELRPQ